MNGHGAKSEDIRVRSVDNAASPDQRADALCSEIDRTRSHMSGTINELEERLSPSRMKEQLLEQLHDAKDRLKSEVREDLVEMKGAIRKEIDEAKLAMREATIGRVEHMVQGASETINETGSTLMSTIRDNPIPLLLTGVGLTWLFMNARSQRQTERARSRGHDIGVRDMGGDGMLDRGQRAVSQAMHGAQDFAGRTVNNVRDAAGNLVDQAGHVMHDAESRVETVAHQVGESVNTVAHQVGDNVSSMAHQAQDAAAHLAQDAQQRAMTLARQTRIQAQRLEQSAETTMRENPLAVGAAAFALGAAVGLALPHTRREDELIGGVRDELLKKAERLASDAVGAASQKAESFVHDMG